MSILIISRGKSGASSVDGLNGLGTADVKTDKLDSPVFDVLKSNKLSQSGSINFDRGSLASHENRHHKNVWARNSSTTNFIIASEDFTQWDDPSNRWTIIGPITDPFGGNLATEINLDVDTDILAGLGPVIEDFTDPSMVVGGYVTVSFWIKTISGTVSALDIIFGSSKFTMDTPTASFQRLSISIPVLSAGPIFTINPRGKTGARIGIFGVQIEDNLTTTEYIKTDGAAKTVAFNGEIERESDNGWLIEQEKQNAVIYSADLSQTEWTKTNVTIDTFTGEDPFGDTNQNIRLVWGTAPEITLDGQTASLTESATYTISFWAFISGGSLSGVTVSLGGGTAVAMPQVSVIGFVRITAAVVAGSGIGIQIKANSSNLTANLNISGIQAELGNLTSYIKTGSLAQTRLPDVVTCDSAFNIPKPSKAWSFIFRHNSVLNNSDKKYIFTNDKTGVDEFSCFFTDAVLSLKNGSVSVDIAALLFEKIAITFDGSTLKIYNESTLIIQSSITPSTFISTTFFIGMDSLKANALNAHLSNFLFYDVELSTNEIIYLMGA